MSTESGPEPTPLERSEMHVGQLEDALMSRGGIARAQGILMERYHLDEDGALDLMKRISSTTNTKVRDVAEQLVAGVPIEDLQPPGPRTEKRS